MDIGSTLSEDLREAIERVHFSGKICKRCGKRSPEGASHCRHCGYSKPDKSKSKWYRRKNTEPEG